MKIWRATKLLNRRFILGESPVYDLEKKELCWVDIKTGSFYSLHENMTLKELQLGQYLGAAIPTKQGNYVGLLTDGVYLFDSEHILEKLYTPERLHPGLRFNDAKCDAKGRLWAGTMSLFRDFPCESFLYRFDGKKHQKPILEKIGTSNGMAWSIDNKIMYYIDTATGGVDAFEFHDLDGSIRNRKRIITIQDGYPDGMTIDEEGMLWIAVWGSGEIRRFNTSTGCCIGKVEVPTPYVSSCCFGGDDLKTLYITTAGEGQDNDAAGLIYYAKCDVAGTVTQKFDENL